MTNRRYPKIPVEQVCHVVIVLQVDWVVQMILRCNRGNCGWIGSYPRPCVDRIRHNYM